MRSQKAHAIGIVSFWDIHNHVFVKNLKGIVETANKLKYSVVLCPVSSGTDDYSYIEFYKNRRIDGIVLIAPVQSERVIDEQEHINRMKAAGVPFVMINTSLNIAAPNFFRYDFRDAVYTATAYLYNRGHRDISYIAPACSEAYPEIYERQKGYEAAIEQFGLKPVIYNIDEIGPAMLRKLSAVVTNKSDTAKRIMDKAIALGFHIPDDFSIVAANVENYSPYLYVPLTCSQIPILSIAKKATAVLIDGINGKPVDILPPIRCEICEGQSVKQQ